MPSQIFATSAYADFCHLSTIFGSGDDRPNPDYVMVVLVDALAHTLFAAVQSDCVIVGKTARYRCVATGVTSKNRAIICQCGNTFLGWVSSIATKSFIQSQLVGVDMDLLLS